MSDSSTTDLEAASAPQTAAQPTPAQQSVQRRPRAVKDLAKADDSLSGKFVMLTVANTKEDTQKGPLFVGLNGNGYQIPRGVPCRVPVEVVKILNDAIETVYDASTGLSMDQDDVIRHNFSYVDCE